MKKSNKKGIKNKLIVVGVIALAFILLGLGNISWKLGGNKKSTRELALSCTLDMYTQFHIHPHLTIIINGSSTTIPASLGITVGCMHPIHTHDDTGAIHVESPEKRDFVLSDFFAVWGKTFNKNQILNSVSDTTHTVTMTVNGDTSGEYENLILRDKDEIVIEYKQK